ncbi:hypothetical protein CMV_003078 [Castanea mollissima]|uniref:Transposase MuDR plant domain-containing protein n=1 Tax=Castanea mollissima TaxID=60419 RepID=A0A8J4VVI7_9ROSI|nr:hypothetical protein CMV_003078 [Castanea mollissima]
MDFHFFYVYYDGEMYYHDLHGLSYQGSNQKQNCVRVKRGIGLMKLQRRILKVMRLDHSRHKISIVYRAPQRVLDTHVFYNSLQLSSGTQVKMMWEIVEQMVVKGFFASDLYVTVEPTIVEAGEGSQHTVLDGTVDEHIDSIPLQSYQGCAENTGDEYGTEPWQTFPHASHIEEEQGPQEVHAGEHFSHDELHGGTSEPENDDGLGDDATDIDVTRDEFEERLETMGEHDDVDHIEDVVVEENRDTCPGPDPTPEWFTKNSWDNMFDPSPVMQAEVSSWTPGQQPMKGMVFATKFAVRHALTWYALRENFKFKTEHSDSERLMVSCEDDSCPWSVRAICCKGDNVWKIAKCKGPHTCDKIQNAHDGRMIDSVFLAYVLERYIREDPAYKIKNLRHVALADLKHEVSHYKLFHFDVHEDVRTIADATIEKDESHAGKVVERHCLYIKHPNLFGGSEKLDVSLDKGLYDSNVLIAYRRPRPELLAQQSFVIQVYFCFITIKQVSCTFCIDEFILMRWLSVNHWLRCSC